jgi:ferredoxin
MLYINPVECIDCGACQPACPVTAIFPEAEVPADQQAFTPINELWYSDPTAARAQVQQLAGSAAAPAAASMATAGGGGVEDSAPPAVAASDAAAAAATPAPGAAPAAAADAAGRGAPLRVVEQVAAEPPAAIIAARGPSHLRPTSLVAIALLALVSLIAVAYPGPEVFAFDVTDPFGSPKHVEVRLTFLLLTPLAMLAGALFLKHEFTALGNFAASGPRRFGDWRWPGAEWRRSEEMRRYSLEAAVKRIAEMRYDFPSPGYPELRTLVNLPVPQMALEFASSGGEKVFPDILVVRHPGNYPAMVVQVETAETLTREQALYVWTRLENEQAPLDLYVPSGLASRAKDYARAAGIKHVRFRTWRWQPTGIIVREV